MENDIIHIRTAKPDFQSMIEIEVLSPSDFLNLFNKLYVEADFVLIASENAKEYFMYPHGNYIFKIEAKGYKSLPEFKMGADKGCMLAEDFYRSEAMGKGYESDRQYFEARALGFVNSIEEIQSKYQYYVFHDQQIRSFLDVTNEGNFFRSVVNAGFKNLNDFDRAIHMGFKDSSSFYKAMGSGFKNAHEFEEACRMGFENESEYHESKRNGYSSKMEVNFMRWRESSGFSGNKLDADFLYYLVHFILKDIKSITASELYEIYKSRLSEVFGIKFSPDYNRLAIASGIIADKERDRNSKLYKISIRYKEDMIFTLTEKFNISDLAEYDAVHDMFIFKK